jgi:hypothetical protein
VKFFKTSCHFFLTVWVKIFIWTHWTFCSQLKKKERPRQLSWGQNRCHPLKLSPLWWIDCGVPSTPPVCTPPPLPNTHTTPNPPHALLHTNRSRGCFSYYTCWFALTVSHVLAIHTALFCLLVLCIPMREEHKIMLVCIQSIFNRFLSVWSNDLPPKTLLGFRCSLVLS